MSVFYLIFAEEIINFKTVEKTLRAMASERAKGELRSILYTYTYKDTDAYNKAKKAIEDIVEKINNEIL